MFTVLTITYLGARIGYLFFSKGMEWNKIKLTYPFYSRYKFIPFILTVPFLSMAFFKLVLFVKASVLPMLRLTGLYFKFLPHFQAEDSDGELYH